MRIAIGGDGSFLKMVKQANFNSNPYYIGVNTGTLGFLQEIKPDKLEEFDEAWKKAYKGIEAVSFDGMFFRKDIGLPGAAESGEL